MPLYTFLAAEGLHTNNVRLMHNGTAHRSRRVWVSCPSLSFLPYSSFDFQLPYVEAVDDGDTTKNRIIRTSQLRQVRAYSCVEPSKYYSYIVEIPTESLIAYKMTDAEIVSKELLHTDEYSLPPGASIRHYKSSPDGSDYVCDNDKFVVKIVPSTYRLPILWAGNGVWDYVDYKLGAGAVSKKTVTDYKWAIDKVWHTFMYRFATQINTLSIPRGTGFHRPVVVDLTQKV